MASILVVDDEMGIRELLHEILTEEGHTVYPAESAMQARAVREQMEPDLVLLDIWMPDTKLMPNHGSRNRKKHLRAWLI